jgi:hypothetical protein
MENPYSSPEYQASPIENQGAVLSDSMTENLKAASPWIRFIAILGFVGAGFLALGAVITLLGGGAIVALLAQAAESVDIENTFGGGVIVFFGMMLAASAVLTFLPAYYAYKFGEKLRSYYLTKNYEELETAFKNNHSLWKFLGIVTIIWLVFSIFGFPIAAIIGAAATAF